jgi:hypothetical protein
VRLAAVAAGDRGVEGAPLVQDRELGIPGHPAEVGVPDRDETAGPGDPAHLAQRPHRVAQVLQDLVGVHDVEAAVRIVQGVDVAGGEAEVRPAAARRTGLLDDLRRRVDAGHLPLRHPVGQARGDRAGTAADIEDLRVRGEERQQEGGAVLGGAPLVRAQD